MEVQCPSGFSSGDLVEVMSPQGAAFTVEVPDGVQPGESLAVSIPDEGEYAAEDPFGSIMDLLEAEPLEEEGGEGGLDIQCPEGVKAGEALLVTAPDGSTIWTHR